MDFPGKNTGVGSLSVLQGIFLTQVLNPGFLNCRQIFYCLNHQESPQGINICDINSLHFYFKFLMTTKSGMKHYRSSVQFSHSVLSDSLWPHGLQHARLPCPSTTPGAYSNSCPSSRWCHPIISSSVVPFSSCLQSFPASGSFPMSWLFTSDGQRIGGSVSESILPMNIKDWFPLGWTGLIFLQPKGLLRVFSNITVQKHQFFGAQLSL